MLAAVIQFAKSSGLCYVIDYLFYYTYIVYEYFEPKIPEVECEVKVNEEDKVKETRYDINTGMITVKYVMDTKLYTLQFNRTNDRAGREVKNIFIQTSSNKRIEDVTVNGEKKHISLFNSFYGPNADFHSGLTGKQLRIRDILPQSEWEGFHTLTLINSDVEFFESSDLDEVIEFM